MNFIEKALPHIQALSAYQSGKPIEELERELGIKNIIKLASNENPTGFSELAKTSMLNHVAHLTRYPDGNGFELKQKIAQKCGVNTACITLGNGSSDILDFVVKAFLSEGDEAIYSIHAFVVYQLLIQAVGAKGVAAPAKNWGHDLAAMQAAITDKTKLIFIANPNNPTGTWLTRDEIRAFLVQVPSHIIVVLDEAYFEYVEEDAYGSGLELLSEFSNVLVTRTFSKIYGLAGLRVGYGIAGRDITDVLNRVRPPFNVNSLALVAACAMLEDIKYEENSRALNTQGLRFLEQSFDALAIKYIPSVGNFISFDVQQSAMPVYEALLREGIIVRPIGVYAMPQHLRVSVGTLAENKRFIDALKIVLQKLPAQV